MLTIYDFETARETILRRTDSLIGEPPRALLEKVEALFGNGTTPEGAVAQILASVRAHKDSALRRWSAVLDGAEISGFRIPKEQLTKAVEDLNPDLLAALNLAIERIRNFHRLHPLISWTTEELGGRLGLRVTAIPRVGVYVPGGSAPLPSSLLMGVIPAQVAGVDEVIVCTPPNPHPTILAAAHLCDIDSVFQIGGAQAIAAMAYGTESVPKVDKIVGPGNIFVTLAKQQVYGVVGLDGLAGPTETLILADHTADPGWVAVDLLAQAEHDPLAAAILITPDRDLAESVREEVSRRMEALSRSDIIRESLSGRSGIVLTPDLETAAELADEYAPEHLCLAVAEPEAWAEKVRNAGALFIGEHSFEVLGDYVAGPNHVLPTGGSARFNSALTAMDFVKFSAVIALDRITSADLSRPAARIARAESLTAHAAAAESRYNHEA
jgi:histidinol dehydrogenase